MEIGFSSITPCVVLDVILIGSDEQRFAAARRRCELQGFACTKASGRPWGPRR
jgi:hypothetical protein